MAKKVPAKTAAKKPKIAAGKTVALRARPAGKETARKSPPSARKLQSTPSAKVQSKRVTKPAPTRVDQIRKIAGKKAVGGFAKLAGSKAEQKPAVVIKPSAATPTGGVKPLMPKAAPFKHPAGAVPAGAAMRSMPAAAHKTVAQKVGPPATPKALAEKAALARQKAAVPKKPVSQRHGFKTTEWIVYPAHGVGRIVAIEEQEIAGIALELFVITFDKDKMTLRVPTGKSQSVGMRKLAEEGTVKRAMETLKGKARVKRTMWSRRAQEYEAKINSGDLISIAEVVRDLYRSESQPEQSYSERQLYEQALDRMARELAAVEKLDDRGAIQRITEVLAKSAKGRRLAAEEAEVKARAAA